jgi:DNA-binding response OmpR family regulator
MGYKILITDDNTSVVEVLVRRLEKEGYTVVAAYDGEDAISKIEQEDPDILLLDLMMPKVNGFEVLKELQRRRMRLMDKWRPVIVISAKDESEALKDVGDEFNTVQYMTKPCSIADILATLRRTTELLERVRENIRISTENGERPI